MIDRGKLTFQVSRTRMTEMIAVRRRGLDRELADAHVALKKAEDRVVQDAVGRAHMSLGEAPNVRDPVTIQRQIDTLELVQVLVNEQPDSLAGAAMFECTLVDLARLDLIDVLDRSGFGSGY